MTSMQTRRIPSVEEIQATLVTPNVFFGRIAHWHVSLKEDPNGTIQKNGKKYSYKREATFTECDFSTLKAAKDHLENTYNWWRETHPNSKYLTLDECLKWCEPECPRENPEMHGVRLVMLPQPSQQ